MEIKKLKRTAIISFLDDPYLAILFKRIYDKNIKDEIDELIVSVNGENKEIVEFIRDLWLNRAKEVLVRITKGKTVAHGEALNEMYKKATGDILITLDSDNFIYRKGIIDRYCRQIDNGLDYVGSLKPFMSFFRKSILDEIKDVDFRDYHSPDGKFQDTMERLVVKLFEKTNKIEMISVDNLPEYEHTGRMSAFPIYVEDCWFKRDVDLDRPLRKLFGRANRVGLIKYIFDITKKDYPNEEYNEFYWRVFQSVIADVGHELYNIDKIIKDKVQIKFKEYE